MFRAIRPVYEKSPGFDSRRGIPRCTSNLPVIQCLEPSNRFTEVHQGSIPVGNPTRSHESPSVSMLEPSDRFTVGYRGSIPVGNSGIFLFRARGGMNISSFWSHFSLEIYHLSFFTAKKKMVLLFHMRFLVGRIGN